MEIALIVFLACGAGLMFAGLVYDEDNKPKRKLPDYVVVADDGDDD